MIHIYADHKDFPPDAWRWPHFSPKEISCPHCTGIKVDTEAMDGLEEARVIYGKSILIASGYSCPTRNAEIGRKPTTSHAKGCAFDAYPLANGNLGEMIAAFHKARVLGFGMGANKLHFDWDIEKGQRAWHYGGG